MSIKTEKTSPIVPGFNKTGTLNGNSETKSTAAKDFVFEVPPEAPVFEPTEEEFLDPLAFINKIRPIAERFGVCKIKPPAKWQPPFAVDVDKLRFTPRIQRLNELEAKTRVKLNFLDQIAKFWELQGSSLKIPVVERKALDLYTLYRLVQDEGGLEVCVRERKWSKIAARLGHPQGKGVGGILKTHYERILYPFDVFRQGKVLDIVKLEPEEGIDEKNDKDYKPHGIICRQAIKPPAEKHARRSKRFENLNNAADKIVKCATEIKSEPGSESEQNKELRRLHIYGAGPKMAGYDMKKMQKKKSNYDFDPLAKYICHNCRRGDGEESMLLCDGCDDSYHTFCLHPPLAEVPKGDWRCPKCVALEVSKPMEAFGFEQAQREYTLQQFGEMADQFKSDYFNMPVHMVPTSTVEKEFWRIVSSIDEDVTVEYGADLHTMDHGSGFPTKTSLNLFPGDQEYADSSWNLNNLPVLEGSVLGYINADISGMKVPWMYVGMCFATFCWHNEDHWSYSINYLHWGEPKTWYGVPGSKAELFEETMKSAAPELFLSQPDLLHQLVTIMNPNILMNAGVPVYRTDQHAGEFVVTFPRAYHAGFNQGYNFAEAVNFAPADWLKMGRECVTHYSHLRRFCVFSHDELVCKMALDPDRLDLTVAAATYQDMLIMVDNEKKMRKSLLEWGVTEAEREAFELLPDDERQCEVCKTTCFLSAMTCSCSQDTLVCLRHYTSLCKCPPDRHTLRYRYTLDELPLMLQKLKLKAESFDNWVNLVKDALDRNTAKTMDLAGLKELLTEAETKKFPKSDLLQTLILAVDDAEKCASVIKQLDLNKMRTRTRNSNDAKYKLTVEELTLFCDEIDSLACNLKEAESVKELLQQTIEFQQNCEKLLNTNIEEVDLAELDKCITFGSNLCIELPKLASLRTRAKQCKWLKEYRAVKQKSDSMNLETMRSMLASGIALPPEYHLEKELAELQILLNSVEEWEEKAKNLFENRTTSRIDDFEKLLSQSNNIKAYLPSQEEVEDVLKKAKEWKKLVEELQALDHHPYFESLEEVINQGLSIPVLLDDLERLEMQLNAAKNWKDRTARTFLRKNSCATLMEALSPRHETSFSKLSKKKKANDDDKFAMVSSLRLCGDLDAAKVVSAFKEAEEKELAAIRDLRAQNIQKFLVDSEEESYCLCQGSLSGMMLQCELCKDWFHSACVTIPKNLTSHSKSKLNYPIFLESYNRDCRFLCPHCLRTRRPRLETILSLLVSLQKLSVRLPEGEALQCLTERAMNWQDRTRQLLAAEELVTALGRLSFLSQKREEAIVREKTEKIINAELKKAANNPDLQFKCHTPVVNTSPSSFTYSLESGNPGSLNNSQQSTSSKDGDLSSSPNSDHAYSLMASPNGVPKKKSSEPLLQISARMREQLESLMIEGDLLEVSLDEVQHLWRLLKASKSLTELDRTVVNFELFSPNGQGKKLRGKKRKCEDLEFRKKMKSDRLKMRRGIKRRKEVVKKAAKRNTSDDEEDCAAKSCLQPSGREVDWVQCDGGCDKWFHMLCVGLDKHDINEDEDYFCAECSKLNPAGIDVSAAFPSESSQSDSCSSIFIPDD